MNSVNNKVFIISGEQGAGKTSCLSEVIKSLQKRGVRMHGFISIGYWSDGFRSGFDLVDINSNETYVLCSLSITPKYVKTGKFYFNPETIKLGEKLLLDPNLGYDDVIVIDEIGLFEMKGKIWADSLSQILQTKNNPILITVRDKFAEEIISHFKLQNTTLFNLKLSVSQIADQIYNSIK